MTDLKLLLETLDGVMLKIKAAADLPGISLIPYVSTLSSVIGAAHAAYTVGNSIVPYIEAIQTTFSGDALPSQADIDALNAKIVGLEAQIQAPLPPKEANEPD